MKKINVKKLTSLFIAYNNCIVSNNIEWKEKHQESINEMLKDLPSGSGLDAGIKFNWDESNNEKLVFNFSFHHMNETGYYDGWSDHKLVITPSLAYSINIKITGKNRNNIKDYLIDTFHEVFEY